MLSFESWCWFISQDSMAPFCFETAPSSFSFQWYGATSTPPSCQGMPRKEMASMSSAVPCLTLTMMDIMMPRRLWSSKNILPFLLTTALKWDHRPDESAQPFLSHTIRIYVCDISDYPGSPLKYLINFNVLLSVW